MKDEVQIKKERKYCLNNLLQWLVCDNSFAPVQIQQIHHVGKSCLLQNQIGIFSEYVTKKSFRGKPDFVVWLEEFRDGGRAGRHIQDRHSASSSASTVGSGGPPEL